ncbi:dTMP kinase [Catenulispora pinisilvae]|uniref:dTMP kinase n=1 Tax=Catenulispora pinisilvae TaxID=2705253 RepID=UPI001890BEBB|nr:dTMP kinase [Catenulispora pinisilvae]
MESSPVGIRDVLAIPDFRRLWTALSLSSLGDWLGLLAQSSLAVSLAGGGYASRSYAVAGVFVVRLIPAVLFGPIAGVAADRLDRRWTMVTGDSARCLLFITIPLMGTLWWLFAATFLIEIAAMFWIPAKEATVPNLVPPRLLEPANQISLLTAYGTAPIAAGVFTVLALITKALAHQWTFFTAQPVDLALYFDALTFLFSALTIARLKSIPARSAMERAAERRHTEDHRSPLRTLLDGWRYLGIDKRIRGVIIGTAGAFAAGGAVVGLARTYVGDLHGGQAAYGVLFGTVFLGLAAGMFSGSRMLPGMARERLFGSVIFAAGVVLCLFALVPVLLISVVCALVIGFLGGTAWIIGQTMLGREVADELRGRTFAFVQSLIRVILVLILAVAPAVAGVFGAHTLRLRGLAVTYGGAAITLFGAGLLAAGVGWVAYRMMDDVPGKSLRNELKAALKRSTAATSTRAGGAAGSGTDPGPTTGAASGSTPGAGTGAGPGTGTGAVTSAGNAGNDALLPDSGAIERTAHTYTGTFLSFEGGDGSGKSTQLDLLADWLRGRGHEVVVTREPGGTPLGTKLRGIVLDAHNADVISPRAEALIYAADRADHVERVIRPALERGAVVITDRYVDSSLAYQGAGRALSAREVELLSHWATQGLMPDVTILMDLDPIEAARRRKTPADRLELESVEFHRRVRNGYLELAKAEPGRFIVINAQEPVEQISGRIRARLEGRIHLSRQQRTEEAERREQERRKAAEQRAVQMAELSDAERRRAEAEAEQRDQAQREQETREAARQEHRRRLEEDAARAERAARERAQSNADLATRLGQTERPPTAPEWTATPPGVATPPRTTAPSAQPPTTPAPPSTTPTQPPASPHAEDIATPSTRGEWEVPDYVAEPEFDEEPEQDAMALADELFGVRQQTRHSGEDA